MSKDYYKILEINRDATEAEIKKAYHKLALAHHPDKSDDPNAEEKFKEIGEAYAALQNPEKKAGFDRSAQFEEDLVRDFFFRTFFSNGFSSFNQSNAKRERQWNSYQQEPPKPPKKELKQDPPVYYDIFVTLEEINSGTVKQFIFYRKGTSQDGKPYKQEKKLDVKIQPGCESGTKIIFAKECDRNQGTIPADIVFTVREVPHKLFKRHGDDIVYEAKISLKDANGEKLVLEIPTLSGKKITLDLKVHVIVENSTKIIANQGLPSKKKQKGSMIVKFKIIKS